MKDTWELDAPASLVLPSAPSADLLLAEFELADLAEGLGSVEVFLGNAELIHWDRKAWLEAREPWLLSSSLSLSEEIEERPPSAYKEHIHIELGLQRYILQYIHI